MLRIYLLNELGENMKMKMLREKIVYGRETRTRPGVLTSASDFLHNFEQVLSPPSPTSVFKMKPSAFLASQAG